MGDDSEAGSEAGSEDGSLRVTPTGGFSENVCFAMGGDSDSENGSRDSSGSSEYTSANSSDGDDFCELSACHRMDESSEDEASGDDLEDIYSFSIDKLADALQAGVSPAEIENHVRGVLMGHKKEDPKAKSENPKAKEEIIQEMVQIEEKVQSTVKKAIRKSLGRMSVNGSKDPLKEIQKARKSAVRRHRQSLGLGYKADEEQEAKIAQAREEAKVRRRKSLAKILTQTCQAAAEGKNIDAAIREAAEAARARHRKSIAKSFTDKKAPADLGEAFEVDNDTLAQITKARSEAVENRRKSLALKQQQMGSPEKPKASPEKEDVQDQVRRAMALAAERRRQSLAEKQKHKSPEKASTDFVPQDNREFAPQAHGTTEWQPQTSASHPLQAPPGYTQQPGSHPLQAPPGYTQQAGATPNAQATPNDWTAQTQQQDAYQWQQGSSCAPQQDTCQWQQADNGWQPQQQIQHQQQQNSCQWQQQTYQQQGMYGQPQQQDAYHWQQHQNNNCEWQQGNYQVDAYGNYQQQGQDCQAGWQQQGGGYQQGMSPYGWQVQQEWQQNNDGTFYNTQTPSWQASMSPEELRIQRTVADMCRSDMYMQGGTYGHYPGA